MKYSKKHGVFLFTVLFLALLLCSTVSAAPTGNVTLNVSGTGNVTNSVISGKVIESPSNSGLTGVSIKAETTGGNLLAETITGTNGTYALNFTSSDKAFKVTASKLGYISYTQNVNVSPNANDPNTLYGTANFTLYKLPAYSGNASSYVLNVGVLPQVLLDLYAGKSNSWVNSTASPYASSEDTPLEIRLLNGSLLSGLLDVKSIDDQGTVTGGILPSNLPALLQVLGLKVGLLNATANSSTHPPAANGGSGVASVDLNLLNIAPVLNLSLITADTSVTPNSDVSAVTSTSRNGVADITLLGGILQIKALQVNATATANGQPGGASANFKWSVADILLNGKSILSELTAKLSVELPGVLNISIGNPVINIAADGTSASVSGDAINVELLGLLLGGVKLTIGHADTAAQFLADQKADLSLTKTVDNAKPQYQQNVTFTLTAHNNGPANATNVMVTDKLPAGLKFVSADGNYNATSGVWTIGNLASGATATLKIIAQAIAANTQLTNIAVIGGNQTDNNSGNNQANVTINVGPASDLGINITANNMNPAYLSYVTFTLTGHNYGPNDAANVKVYNTLPAGFKYISDDSGGKFNSTSGLWSVGPLSVGASAILHIVAQAMIANATVTDSAYITDPDPTNTTDFYDPNDTNNNASVSVDVGAAVDNAITMTASVPRCCNTDEVVFTLTARNNGPNNATGVTVMTTLPGEFKFLSTSGDGTYNTTNGAWTIGNLASGATATLKLTAVANSARTTVATGASIFGYQFDTNMTNNNVNLTTIMDPLTDLSITKTADKNTVNYLQNVAFTLTAHNNGPDNATGVTVTDKLPAGLKFLSATGGTYNATSGVWTIGNLASGATATLKIIAQAIVSNTRLTNAAVINPNTAADEIDRNTTNNQANVTVAVTPASDLSVTKTVNNANPKYLDNVTFTLTAHNYGPDAATGVAVTDKLPAGLQFVSATGGAYNATSGVWTIGNLANGANAVLSIVAKVMVSNTKLTNIAVVNGTNYDQGSNNNKGNTTVTVGPASDLSITKTASASKINYLGQVTFTLTARNNGPNNATGVVVTDKLPAGLQFVSATGGTYNATSGVWTIGNLANGATATLKIVAKGIAANAALTNVAVVSGTNYDQNSTNNKGNTTVNVGPASDLGITMAVNNPRPKYLDTVIFTLTASNAGPNPAPNVKVYVTLPAGLKFISADGAYNATYNSTTGLWSVGPMAVNTTKQLHITAQAMVSNIVLTAKAYITDPPEDELSLNDFFDPNGDNDNADSTVDVGENGSSDTDTDTPSNTIPMQKTGTPIAGMLLAALMVFVGIRPKMK